MEYLRPTDLLGLTPKQLRDYKAQLDRHRTHRLPWEAHTASMRFWSALGHYELELRRRGTQMSLFEAERGASARSSR